MRAAWVVTPVLATLFASLASGCATSEASRFCGALTSSKLDFVDVQQGAKELAAIDQVISALPARDRHLVIPVRDYARILYGKSNWSEQHKLTFLNHFFKTDAPALDKRLRHDCHLDIDKRIAPFYVLQQGKA